MPVIVSAIRPGLGLLLLAFLLFHPAGRVWAAGDVIITEFMADNASTIADEDGDFPDWLEIHNAGTNTVDLGGWYLSDSSAALTRWRFPATPLPANAYLLVFASGKDRRTSAAPLHTNFKLSSTGGYLALVEPDGVTVASAYSPGYPLQVQGISYGFPTTQESVQFIGRGSPALLSVPVNELGGTDWVNPGYDDRSWIPATNGVGFHSDPAKLPIPERVADSAGDFSGTQGASGWFYGYWDPGADSDGVYQAGDFTAFPRSQSTVPGAANYWNGTNWVWPTGNPPLLELTASGGRPAGREGGGVGPVYWLVRRYVSATNGPLRITGTMACSSKLGTCGDGVVCRVVVDGVDVFHRPLRFESVGYSILVEAGVGSSIDFIVDPGPAGDGQCDATTFTALVRTAGGASPVADSIADWSPLGIQGEKNWSYGRYDRTADTGFPGYQATNFAAFPRGGGPWSQGNFWTGEAWQWYGSGPPFDLIGETLCRPSLFPTSSGISGNTNNNEHWVIRRWTSDLGGTLSVDWHLGMREFTGSGVRGQVFLNGGAPRDAMSIAGDDFVGKTRTVVLTNVQPGDVIDFVVDPSAAGATDPLGIVGDLCSLNAVIHAAPRLSSQITSDIGSYMTNLNASAYVRLPFTVEDPGLLSSLLLRVKYDDGFLAYLNGTLVASRNAPETPAWNSGATAARSNAEFSRFEDFNLSGLRDLLRVGTNVLAIHGLNFSAADPDFLLLAELRGTQVQVSRAAPAYLLGPTPGFANTTERATLGPIVSSVSHLPEEPAVGDDLIVTARVTPALAPVASVVLTYRIMYGSESNIVMSDDGLHRDGVAGDGVYGAYVPLSLATNGQMVRYFLTATDAQSAVTRDPPFPDPLNSSQYHGTVMRDPSLTNTLPVLHWFTRDVLAANSDAGSKGTLFFLGELYDNVLLNLHGQSSRGFPKHSYDIDFNGDHKFRHAPGQRRVGDINLLSTYPDKAHMRNILAHGTHRDAGLNSPYHFVQPVRVQQNAQFFGDWHMVENGDADFLRRIGRDPNGALYKCYDTLVNPNSEEKKTRKAEDRLDLAALIAGAQQTGPALRKYLYDNVDISEVINYLAAMILTANTDCCHKNYYLYRDTEGDGEWEMFPWDVDLSFGRNWTGPKTYYDEFVYTQNPLYIGNNNTLPIALFTFGTDTRQMYLRRVRTLMDQLLQPAGTPTNQLKYEAQIDYWAGQIAPDAALDLAKWGTWADGSAGPVAVTSPFYLTLTQAVSQLKDIYLPGRRAFMYSSAFWGADLDPGSVPANATVEFGALDFNPVSGNQAEEYLQLTNPTPYSLDISGWHLSGGIDHTFQAGVVLVPHATLYVVNNKRAFRQRAVAPTGGQGLYVEGPYQGQLSARGETVILSDPLGHAVATKTYEGNPSAPQQFLRVTEIMYHPPLPPAGSPYEADDFEYIELMNTGPAALPLQGVHFTNSVEFTFPNTSLAPGARLVVVRNAAAFASRYGSALHVAGQYRGQLDDGGGTIRIDDAVGEKILDFRYDNNWYPVTDGPGSALAIVNPGAAWNTWDQAASWRPSAQDFGSPGAADPAPIPNPTLPVLVNEVLSRPELPQVDAIELLNPNTAPVDVSGWFLSDDFTRPKKLVIPPGTVIAPGDFLVFKADTSFGLGPTAFALSSRGDETYLFSGDGAHLTGYVHGHSFGLAANGVSFGRHTNSEGRIFFVSQASPSLGAPNAPPRVGPVVISEIHYHPLERADNQPNSLDEYLELANVSGAALTLSDPAQPTNTWRIRDGISFDFPTNFTLPADGRALIVSFNPADASLLIPFRARFGVPDQVPVLGPYLGQLGNGSDQLSLSQPEAVDARTVLYRLIDQVRYDSAAPWPVAADGIGPSLQRRVENSFGNEPTNWVAAAPSPGRSYPGGVQPGIATAPLDTSVVAFLDTRFTVTPLGLGPFYYQWRFKGANLPGATNATLVLSNVQPSQAGDYVVVILNSAGSIASPPAMLTVLMPATIELHPQSQNIRLGSNVTFTVKSTSRTPMRYQWLFNGSPIPDATNTSLTFPNVQLPRQGLYRVVVTDDVGPIYSQPALLNVLINPVITQQPQSITAVQGDTVNFYVAASGNPLPITYRWRRNGATLTNLSLTQKTASFTLTNVQPAQAGNYTVVVGNLANSVGVLSATAALVVLTDADGDHLPDTYETAARGLNPADPADALLDFDHDGFSNLQEYLAGTDPNDAASHLMVSGLTRLGGSNVVSFLAMSNRNYTVQFREAPGAGLWTRLADVNAASTNRVMNVLDPYPLAAGRIYRLVTPLQPPPGPGPVILVSPASATVPSGATMTLRVEAASGDSPAYQWRLNGTNLPGATNLTFSLINAPTDASGVYSVEVSDASGKVVSAPATVGVLTQPVIVHPPVSQVAAAGQSVTFTVEATGLEPLSYRWFFNNRLIRGETGPSLTLHDVTPAEAGSYTVVVKHQTPFGPATTFSAPATLVVRP